MSSKMFNIINVGRFEIITALDVTISWNLRSGNKNQHFDKTNTMVLCFVRCYLHFVINLDIACFTFYAITF